MESLNNTPIAYTEVLETREKAYKFLLASGKSVWLSKRGIAVNAHAKTVSHPYMDEALRQDAIAGDTIDVALLGDGMPYANSIGYDVTFTWDTGDPEFSTTELRIFVGTSIETSAGVPLWIIERSIRERLGDISVGEWTLRNTNGDPIIRSADMPKPKVDEIPTDTAVPEDFANAEF